MPVAAQACTLLEVVAAPVSAGCAPASGASAGKSPPLTAARRILILDDDQEFLDTYSRILARLPSHPQVRVATCATRALSLLEAEPFTLLITDLRMPRIDGFQVLLTARRRFPSLKTVAITGLGDQQYRARAYASGIDLYTEKPTTPTEIRLFSECVEALLAQGAHETGFRGIQSKSLLDLIQIECLSLNSSVLRISRGSLDGRIWICAGTVIDAQLQELTGEEAFREIFSWKIGNFELLPGDPARPRTIFCAYESLLLDSARSFDESAAETTAPGDTTAQTPRMNAALQPMARVRGVEALLMLTGPGKFESWGVDNPEEMAGWTHRVLHSFQALGQILNAGPLRAVEGAGTTRAIVLMPRNACEVMAGLDHNFTPRQIRAAGKELATRLGQE